MLKCWVRLTVNRNFVCLFCHMYFYRICVLYRLRRRAQHKMREKMKWARRWMCVAKRVFGPFFLPGRRWWDNINPIHIQAAHMHALTYACVHVYMKTLAAKKISLEILKALGREKNRIWYSKAKLSNEMKWKKVPECSRVSECECMYLWWVCVVPMYVHMWACVRRRTVACLACN